ncbi:cytosine permease, partial [Mesorhizobium japonicum]|uniref:cytosine permease n=1 Tax=Mesorhizobium japonicum TaxID=2066070 RepID=UPI003B5B4432
PDPAVSPPPEPASSTGATSSGVDDAQLLRDLEGIPTLDAMQRLEQELARRALATSAAPAEPSVSEPSVPEPTVPEPIAPETFAPSPTVPETVAPAPSPAPPRLPDAWDSAPPPGFVPPPLVEPPAPETEPEPLARLLPPPTDLPDIAFRAELPPPPGYAEDGTAAPDAGVAPPAAEGGWDQLFASPPVDAPSLLAPDAENDDAENDDVVDEGDRVAPTGAVAVTTSGIAMLPPMPAPAPAPAPAVAASAPSRDEGLPLPAAPATSPPAFQVEQAGVEPTPLERRAGRASRLFWLWFAANASVVSVSLGAVMFGMGMSLRQAIVATVVGIALSFIPLGFGTLAGRRSGQPTMIVSRAGFGVVGNIVPAFLALAVRVFWGGVLVWLLADAVAQTVVRARVDPGLGATGWALVGLAAGVVLATAVAVLGYGLLARVQLVLSILTGVIIVAAAVVSVPKMHLDVALTHQD